MNKEIDFDFAGKTETSSIFKSEIFEESKLKCEISERRNTSSGFSNTEKTFIKSPILRDVSADNLSVENTVLNAVIVKSEPTANARLFDSSMWLTETKTEIEDLLESIKSHIEEIEEILEMISRAVGKLEFFASRAEYLVKSLQEILKECAPKGIEKNIYLRNMYGNKLEEFGSRILDKIKIFVKDLKADYDILKEQEKKAMETSERIREFQKYYGTCSAEFQQQTIKKLRETVHHLMEEIGSLKPMQFFKLEKVAYVDEDIEMLYDLYHRFTSA